VRNPGQVDTDRDGLGDACDATPDVVAPAAAAPATATAPPASPPPVAAAPPVLGALKAPSRTPVVRLCRGASGCRPAPLTVSYKLDRPAAVTAQVQRRACRGATCRYVTAATMRASAKAGANRLTIGARGATARLRAGSYRLRVVADGAGAASRPRLLTFRVR
jgi:L,D-transpeptidase YcbB